MTNLCLRLTNGFKEVIAIPCFLSNTRADHYNDYCIKSLGSSLYSSLIIEVKYPFTSNFCFKFVTKLRKGQKTQQILNQRVHFKPKSKGSGFVSPGEDLSRFSVLGGTCKHQNVYHRRSEMHCTIQFRIHSVLTCVLFQNFVRESVPVFVDMDTIMNLLSPYA